MRDEIRIQFTRFSAFCSPLIAAIAGGFLEAEGLSPRHSVEMDGFFLTGRAPEPAFTWHALRGKRVLVDHGGQARSGTGTRTSSHPRRTSADAGAGGDASPSRQRPEESFVSSDHPRKGVRADLPARGLPDRLAPRRVGGDGPDHGGEGVDVSGPEQ
jgi:hypothetical protein